jgi:hypothetical protein
MFSCRENNKLLWFHLLWGYRRDLCREDYIGRKKLCGRDGLG